MNESKAESWSGESCLELDRPYYPHPGTLCTPYRPTVANLYAPASSKASEELRAAELREL